MTQINFDFSEPIVLKRRKKKRKKKKRPLSAEMRTSERHLTRAMRRSIRAADRGMTHYRKASKKSSKKRDDGLVVDFVPNMAAATAVTMREMTLVPLDLLKAAYTPQARRIMGRAMRATMRLSDDYLP